ncbi:hypothetical protein FUAX_01240 [Fulvitalea axinellae]|uniref:Uncharacterized protein n=1 Tax=Fulvitalea axinellae TaxID=1182444 RepID=A0AAU9CIL6_9BACT|nr:hypothetical protein FUAX_01240 [Fulvitalea axinellae]
MRGQATHHKIESKALKITYRPEQPIRVNNWLINVCLFEVEREQKAPFLCYIQLVPTYVKNEYSLVQYFYFLNISSTEPTSIMTVTSKAHL